MLESDDLRKEGKRVLEVWDYWRVGLIMLDDNSGTYFSNQVGGVCCLHPAAQGLFVLLPGPLEEYMPADVEDPLMDVSYSGDAYNQVQKFLDAYPALAYVVRRPDSDHPLASELHEAWVPVTVRAPEDHWLSAWNGHHAILTYPNSD